MRAKRMSYMSLFARNMPPCSATEQAHLGRRGAANGTGFSGVFGAGTPSLRLNTRGQLLLDSRIVDLPMSYNPPFGTLSSLQTFFFNGFKMSGHSRATLEPKPRNPTRAPAVDGLQRQRPAS